ncbi:excinuclease UvrABC ATPase subunit [Streptomyces sp. LBL]|nr:excinuclease UvrABC ATPase subunit [Streptomyces sp. LBL]
MTIEHNLDVIRASDWLIDLGPAGGAAGGSVVAEGTPEEVATADASRTGGFLQPGLSGTAWSAKVWR